VFVVVVDDVNDDDDDHDGNQCTVLATMYDVSNSGYSMDNSMT
jgi:hypothetical protein